MRAGGRGTRRNFAVPSPWARRRGRRPRSTWGCLLARGGCLLARGGRLPCAHRRLNRSEPLRSCTSTPSLAGAAAEEHAGGSGAAAEEHMGLPARGGKRMSLYNWYVGAFACPSCGRTIERAQTKFGYLQLHEYRDGDVVDWLRGKALHNGGRPGGGNMLGAGWASCVACDLALFLLIRVCADVVSGVQEGSVRVARASDYGARFVGFEGLTAR